MRLEGDPNDYWGKGLSGGKLSILIRPRAATFAPEENVIIGNVALYGATSGEAVRGRHRRRALAVRTASATAVVEASAITGAGHDRWAGRRARSTGPNSAAGMSGGVATCSDELACSSSRCNKEMVDLEGLDDREDIEFVHGLLVRHVRHTGSGLAAAALLERWDEARGHFVKVIPRDYKRVLMAEALARSESREPRFAELVGAANG